MRGFCDAFQKNHRATLVGEKTAGSSGQPFVHGFDNGMVIRLGTEREFFPNGADLEGVGISSDAEVITTPEDLSSKRDPVLIKVLEMIRSPSPKP